MKSILIFVVKTFLFFAILTLFTSNLQLQVIQDNKLIKTYELVNCYSFIQKDFYKSIDN